jgi:EAL domain-containing protein (putative c-di-GMP-specific phosphodiesterase class I)
VQGFLLARPMSASQVANLLADETPRMRALS